MRENASLTNGAHLPKKHFQSSIPTLDWMQFIIYSGRYALHPVYLSMLIVLALYCTTFFIDIWHFVLSFYQTDSDQQVVAVLQFVDHSMVANLIYLIMVGGYDIFLRKFRFARNEEKPSWLEHIDSYSLKVKMGGSLIGVTTVHLLTSFFDAKELSWDLLGKQLVIHFTFILSTLAIMWISERHSQLHLKLNKEEHHNEHGHDAHRSGHSSVSTE